MFFMKEMKLLFLISSVYTFEILSIDELMLSLIYYAKAALRYRLSFEIGSYLRLLSAVGDIKSRLTGLLQPYQRLLACLLYTKMDHVRGN